MQIDDYAQAMELTEKLKASLPLQVYPTKQMAKRLKAQGKFLDPSRQYTVDSVIYAGDMGGITCSLKGDPEGKEVFSVSITHLRVDPAHPLAEELQAYQSKRTRGLAIQDRGGFAAEFLGERLTPLKKKQINKGFGK
ncbi:hypothetical protein ACKFKG_04345 [Phormidesmis sp. 146-35]